MPHSTLKPIAAALFALGLSGTALADQEVAADPATLQEELRALKARLAQLEALVEKQSQTLERQQGRIEQAEQQAVSSGGVGEWWQGVKMSGAVEIEAMGTDNADITAVGSPRASDITAATVALGIEAQVNDWTSATISLLYEENDTPLEVDEAVITIGNAEVTPFYFSAGQMYVPFGQFDSHMVSDPFTLELGETRETAVLLGFANQGFYGAAYLFNGNMDDVGNNTVDNGGFKLGYGREFGGGGYDVGISYLSDLADSDAITTYLTTAAPAGAGIATTRDNIAAWGAHLSYVRGPFSFIGEYVTAVDAFNVAEIAFRGVGAEPEAWNLELGYGFQLLGRESTFAIGYQETDEAVALGHPEQRTSLGLSVELMENTGLSFEWAHDEAYSTANGGTGQDRDTLTTQLAVEF